MKIIRRKRTVTIETCSFRRWQDEGQEGNFHCPNCGKTFQQNVQLNAAIEKLLPELMEETNELPALPPAAEAERPCGDECTEKTEGNNNHE